MLFLIAAGMISLYKRIALINSIGDNGSAYFGMAYDTFLFLYLVTGYSVQHVLARMISARCSIGQHRNGRRVWKLLFLVVAAEGIAVGGLQFVLAEFLGKTVFGSAQAVTAIEYLMPLGLMSSLLGAFRGYFQGMGSMVPTALSRVVEEAVGAAAVLKLVEILSEEGTAIANLLQNTEYIQAFGAAGGGLGLIVGCTAALLVLAGIYALFQGSFRMRERRDNGKEMDGRNRILSTSLSYAVPVAVIGFFLYGSFALDQLLYFICLPESPEMIIRWGVYTGKVRIWMTIPAAAVLLFCSSVLQGVLLSKESRNQGRVRSKAILAFRVSMLTALPLAVYLWVMSDSLMGTFFVTGDLAAAGSLLRIGSIAALLQAVGVALAGVLLAMQDEKKLYVSAAAAFVIHVIALLLFLLKFDLGIKGVIYAVILLYAAFLIGNLLFIFSELSWQADWGKILGVPVLAAAVGGGVVFFMDALLAGKVPGGALIFLTVFVGLLLYLILVLMLRGISEKELRTVPFGEFFVLIGRTFHFL